jgi:imidazolonepropionase-like amidohydrolase
MKRQLKYVWILCYFIFFTNPTVAQSIEKNKITFIKAGKLFDSENGKILANYIIKIENNKITEIGKNISIPENVKVIDLTEYTVLPGLIDGHTHLMTLDDFKDKHPMAEKVLFEGDALRVLRGANRAKTWFHHSERLRRFRPFS